MATKNEVAEQNVNTEVAVKENTQLSAQKSNNKVTDYSLGIFGTSDNFIMAMQMAKALAESTIVPQTYQNNPSNCLIAIEQAQRMNISPLMVMQNLYPIQGRPSWSSKFLIASINASHKFDIELQYDETKDKDGKPYSCVGKNGSKWKTMPQLMLRYRAASFFSSLNCPELTMGIYTKEEIEDGDFKEYPIGDMKAQVEEEIANNANQIEFSEVVEPQGDQATPEFMKE